jgi:electron transfer flavoprotein alpha subunit
MPVLVYTEHLDGNFKKSAFELVSYAKEVAKTLNTSLTALAIGDLDNNRLQTLSQYGADRIVKTNHEQASTFSAAVYATIIAKAAEQENADVIVLSSSFTGKGLAPAVAIKLKAAVVANAVDLPKVDSGKFLVTKMSFSGKAFTTVEMLSAKKVITLTPNSFEIKQSQTNAAIEELSVDLSLATSRVTVGETIRSTNKVPLPEAEIVVSGGRGLKGPENWPVLENLAEALGAATACSKPVSDAGWRPHEEHVGQTGIVISPNLYIAVGISGAIQHLAGVSSSKTIVAINKDAEAPIFKVADYGIVGDALEVLPKLTQAIKAFKG